MSADATTLGVRLRKERTDLGLSVAGMAEALRDAAPERERRTLPKLQDIARKIRNWEADTWGVSERYRLLYCRATGKTEDDLFGPYRKARKKKIRATETGAARGEDEDDVERRQLLQALATLGVATVSPISEALNTIQTHVEKSLGRDISAQMDDWDEAVAEYGYSYLATAPDRLIGELAADLVSVQALKQRIPAGDTQRARWFRVTAGLSLLMAKTLANTGHGRPARTWWTTAQHAADSSGDTDLSMWIAGERLIRGLYERRPAPVLLRQAATAAESSNGRACAGLLHIQTMRAQLFAVVGRADDAVVELRRAEDTFASLPATDTNDIASDWCYGEDRIRYSTAWVYAYLGQSAPLDVAADRAVQLLEDVDQLRSVTQVKLLQAAGYVRSGDVAAGIDRAISTYEQCPANQRTALVTELAGDVWNAIPIERRRGPAAEGYRELLVASGSLRKAIT
ncbi:hypothetical protein [Actinoallomurus vinaceus]